MSVSDVLDQTVRQNYGSDADEGAHLATMTAYSGLVAVAALVARRRGATVPSISAWDTARMALATYKGARLLTKDKVTAPLRAPFTRRAGEGEANEVNDAPRGEGARHTVGELVSCPFCLGQWIATGLAVGLVLAPGPTRLVASTLAAAAGADFLHHAYCSAQQLPGALQARAD
ncbi:DUF1360 domain-containing protein [Sporichthya brevicatena]|uniref:DUF1360 domain-containing protein n=1 Tax=Sporichthya brevicatena TaxID=171442 RepID=A0ABN1GW74_9ACTN